MRKVSFKLGSKTIVVSNVPDNVSDTEAKKTAFVYLLFKAIRGNFSS